MKQNWKERIFSISFTVLAILSVFLEDMIPNERTLRIIRSSLLILFSLGCATYSLISTVRRRKKSKPFLRSEWLEMFMLGLSVLLLALRLLAQASAAQLGFPLTLVHAATLAALIGLAIYNNDQCKAKE